MNTISKIKQYATEVAAETKKVNWPNKERALKDSTVVVAISLAAAIFLGGIDILLAELVNKFIGK